MCCSVKRIFILLFVISLASGLIGQVISAIMKKQYLLTCDNCLLSPKQAELYEALWFTGTIFLNAFTIFFCRHRDWLDNPRTMFCGGTSCVEGCCGIQFGTKFITGPILLILFVIGNVVFYTRESADWPKPSTWLALLAPLNGILSYALLIIAANLNMEHVRIRSRCAYEWIGFVTTVAIVNNALWFAYDILLLVHQPGPFGHTLLFAEAGAFRFWLFQNWLSKFLVPKMNPLKYRVEESMQPILVDGEEEQLLEAV
jgi:hypothetical protein